MLALSHTRSINTDILGAGQSFVFVLVMNFGSCSWKCSWMHFRQEMSSVVPEFWFIVYHRCQVWSKFAERRLTWSKRERESSSLSLTLYSLCLLMQACKNVEQLSAIDTAALKSPRWQHLALFCRQESGSLWVQAVMFYLQYSDTKLIENHQERHEFGPRWGDLSENLVKGFQHTRFAFHYQRLTFFLLTVFLLPLGP